MNLSIPCKRNNSYFIQKCKTLFSNLNHFHSNLNLFCFHYVCMTIKLVVTYFSGETHTHTHTHTHTCTHICTHAHTHTHMHTHMHARAHTTQMHLTDFCLLLLYLAAEGCKALRCEDKICSLLGCMLGWLLCLWWPSCL